MPHDQPTTDNTTIVHQLRSELAEVIARMIAGRVADRSRLAVRAKELDQTIRRMEGGVP